MLDISCLCHPFPFLAPYPLPFPFPLQGPFSWKPVTVVASLLCLGAVEEVLHEYSERDFYFWYVLIQKKESLCPIIDLRRLNKYIQCLRLKNGNTCLHFRLRTDLSLSTSRMHTSTLPSTHPRDVSKIYSGAKSLSIQGTSLWTLYSKESFYKMPRCGVSTLVEKGLSCLSVSRWLAHQRSITSGNWVSNVPSLHLPSWASWWTVKQSLIPLQIEFILARIDSPIASAYLSEDRFLSL